MDIGVFIPIGNNGWLISKNSPRFKPSFDLNKEIVMKAEKYDMDFALSMIKLRGFGGETEFWDYNLESFTLMAGLAAVTSKFNYMPRLHTSLAACNRGAHGQYHRLYLNGRFGVNLVTGWQRPEYSQMGMWRAMNFSVTAMSIWMNTFR